MKKNKTPTYNMNLAQIKQMKDDATRKAIDTAFILMLAIPTMVIHDKYSQLIKKEGREETFVNLCLDLYESFEKGYVTIDDLKQCLEDEAGIKIEKR